MIASVRPPHDFRRQPDGRYQLLPFRFRRWSDDSVLVTNEAGEFLFLPPAIFSQFARHGLDGLDPWYAELKSKHFLRDSPSSLPLELLATKIRTKRDHLSGFTRLHILVVTLRCYNTCSYCQVSRVSPDRAQFDMTIATAERAVKWAFQPPGKEIKIEFQGGEPTLNWPVIVHTVKLARARADAEHRVVEFVLATNLATIERAMLEFCREHEIQISTSLDGPADLHNLNRPRPGGNGFERLRANLQRAREILGPHQISALMTTSPISLSRPRDIVDAYREMGFESIFLRPISPYGFASSAGLTHAGEGSEFVEFYRAALDYIIDLNRGGTPFLETYAQILLRKILTPFAVGYVDLQSPAGTVLGALVYNYDGGVYASDESRMLAEMGDRSFRLGDLHTDRYREVMNSARVRTLVEQSCLETMPGCSECAFLPYCGADPVRNWATQGDIVGYRPTSEFCKRQVGIFQILFDYLTRGDAFVRRLFLAWASQ